MKSKIVRARQVLASGRVVARNPDHTMYVTQNAKGVVRYWKRLNMAGDYEEVPQGASSSFRIR